MAMEISELMMGAALVYGWKKSDYSDFAKVDRSMSTLSKSLSGERRIKYGPGAKEQFLRLIAPNGKKFNSHADLVMGISAAEKFRKISSGRIECVYMTGGSWHQDIKKFEVSSSTMRDYNSSDVVIKMDSGKYFGISLKKKNTATAADPTMINKAFDTISKNTNFLNMNTKMNQVKATAFANMIRESTEGSRPILLKEDIESLYDKPFRTITDEELFLPSTRKMKGTVWETQGQKIRTFIDIYGSAGNYHPSSIPSDGMRKFVNDKLSNPRNELWTNFGKIIEENSSLIARELIDIILKASLYKKLNCEDMNNCQFEFGLMTAIASITGKDKRVAIQEAKYLPQASVLCGLSGLGITGNDSASKFSIVRKPDIEQTAAKIKMTMIVNDVHTGPGGRIRTPKLNMMDLELRYKGSFTSQPQWLGTLHPDFKDFLKKECGIT